MLILENPSLRTVLLIGVAVWAFSRLYYFLFYVIGRYIDPTFRFAGVCAAVRHIAANRGGVRR